MKIDHELLEALESLMEGLELKGMANSQSWPHDPDMIRRARAAIFAAKRPRTVGDIFREIKNQLN